MSTFFFYKTKNSLDPLIYYTKAAGYTFINHAIVRWIDIITRISLFKQPDTSYLISIKCIIFFIIVLIAGSKNFASPLLDSGIIEFEQGSFSKAKESFKIAKKQCKTASERLTVNSYLFAVQKVFKPRGRDFKNLKDHILRHSKMQDDPHRRFYKVLISKLLLYSRCATSSQKRGALRYLKETSKNYSYAGYILGEYFENQQYLDSESAKEFYIKSGRKFEESKKKLLKLRRKEIMSSMDYSSQTDQGTDQLRNGVSLILESNKKYVDYDIANIYSLLLSQDPDSKAGKFYYEWLSRLAQSGLIVAKILCCIFRKEATVTSAMTNYLLTKTQTDDPIYIAAYMLRILHSLRITSLPSDVLRGVNDNLIKLKNLDYPPAIYEVYLLNLGQNAEGECLKAIKIAAVLGDSRAQHILARHVLTTCTRSKRSTEKAIFWLKRAADKGNYEAEYFLGEAYIKGVFIDSNIQRGLYWLKKAAKHGLIKAIYLLGSIYGDFNKDCFNPEVSLFYLKQAADRLFPPALNALGEIFLKGRIVPRNYHVALEYFAIATEWKYVEAIYNLAWMFQRGRGVKQDEVTASSIFQYGAELEDPRAQHHLAWRYFFGIGVVKDTESAIKWMSKAADNGHIKSCFQLGKIYYFGDWDVLQNVPIALDYFNAASKMGHASSQYYMGKAYRWGDVVAQDYTKAADYFLKAAQQSHIKSCYEIGMIYKWGLGVKQDYAEALSWLKKAAELDYVPAFCQVGHLYFLGLGIDENIDSALYWYRKGEQSNDVDSNIALAKICFWNKRLLHKGYNHAQIGANCNNASGLLLLRHMSRSFELGYKNAIETIKWNDLIVSTNFGRLYRKFLCSVRGNPSFALCALESYDSKVEIQPAITDRFLRASKQYLYLLTRR